MLHAVLRAATEGEEAAPSPLLPAGYDILWSSVCFVIILVFFWRYVLPVRMMLTSTWSRARRAVLASVAVGGAVYVPPGVASDAPDTADMQTARHRNADTAATRRLKSVRPLVTAPC